MKRASSFGLMLIALGVVACTESPIAPRRALTPSASPTAQVAAQASFLATSVTTGSTHACALTSGGVAYCWGDNSYGQLGDGTATQCYPNITCSTTPVPVAAGLTFKEITAGSLHTCGITTGGVAYCWGDDTDGQLGAAAPQTCSVGTPCSRVPIAVTGSRAYGRISAGNRHTCAIDSNGKAYCWGYNVFAALGDGTTTDRATPTPVATTAAFATIGGGTWHTCATTPTHGAVCWGQNAYGQLGATSTDQCVYFVAYACSKTPVAVAGATTSWALVDGGGAFSCGLTTTGAGRCWGHNSAGEVGDGTYIDRPTPVALSGGLTFQSLTVGSNHACAVTSGAVAYCWGLDTQGQLGVAMSTGTGNSAVPVAVHGGLAFAQLAAGNDFTCGVTTASGVYCWGQGHRGQLGNGVRTSTSTPTAVLPPSLVDQPPIAKLVVSGCVNLACTFNATLSFDDKGIVAYDWTFGDGTTATGSIVNHLFPGNGSYAVTLVVRDAAGQTSTAATSVTVTMANQPPSAQFTISCPTLQCSADASASTDDAGIVSYAWVWGNGKSKTVTTPTTTTTYYAPGTYTITLTVTDGGGLTGTSSQQVIVPTPTTVNQPPTAAFTWTCGMNPSAPLQCAFDASTSTDDHGVVSYAWSFGNGKSKTVTTPTTTSTYYASGSYVVTLTASDGAGLTSSTSRTITVP